MICSLDCEFPAGKAYGRLTVLGLQMEKSGSQNLRKVRVACVCGSPEKTVFPNNLRNGRAQSCGCLRQELSSQRATVHGGRGTVLFKRWMGMRDRCKGYKEKDRKSYTERGITICKRWNSFENFRNDMGEPPTPDHQLERINNNRGYMPSNCRWATRIENNNNKRNNRRVTFCGKTQSVPDWARQTGITAKAIKHRLANGWSVKKALTQPLQKRSRP